jgi:hypothetical protein
MYAAINKPTHAHPNQYKNKNSTTTIKKHKMTALAANQLEMHTTSKHRLYLESP